MEKSLNWKILEEELFEKGQAAIQQFAREHPREICSFFAYAWVPFSEELSLCFDTSSNALQVAMENEREAIDRREKVLGQEWSWKNARYFSTHPTIVDYASNIDLFAYSPYAEVRFEGRWEEFLDSDAYPRSEPWEDDYLKGNIRLALWRVLSRLIENKTFSQLHLASPFRVGYQFHDEELVVLRILNWLGSASN